MGLDLMLLLSTARLCSLNLSLGRRLVSPVYIVWMQITGETAPVARLYHAKNEAPGEEAVSAILNNYSSSPNGL